MKILLIVPNIESFDHMPCLSIAYLKGFLNSKKKHESIIVDLAFNRNNWKEHIVNKINFHKPDIIGFSVLSFNYPFALKIAKYIKKRFKIKIIFGGVHAILAPEDVIENKEVDIVCIGEGEQVLQELLDHELNCEKVKGLWYKKNGQIVKNQKRKLIENLNNLAFPDFSDFDIKHYFKINHNHFPIMASRGCPFSCTYCSNHALRRRLDGNYVRFRNVDNVLKEIELRVKQYKDKGIRFLYFFDDTFILKKNFVIKFCNKFKENGFHKIIGWTANVRANLVTDDIIKIMKNAGCYETRMGVESGNDYILTEVYNRNMTTLQLLDAFRIIKKNGMQLRLDFIYGAPYETLSMMDESYELAKKSKADNVFFAKLYPFPGTEIKKICENEKTINYDLNFKAKGMPPVEKTKYVTNTQMNDFKNKINKWQTTNYFREGFQLKGFKFLSDIALFLIYTKFKYDLEFNQIFRWNVRNYKLEKLSK
jgi:radical SAM superfamily enzyme YgiQ (UPF0313 family)